MWKLAASRRLLVQPGIVIALTICGACGLGRGITFNSPSGRHALRIERGGTLSSRVEVRLEDEARQKLLFRSPGEMSLAFAEAYWSPSEDRVGVVLNGSVLLVLAFEVPNARQISPDTLRPSLADKIRQDYRLPMGKVDALRWTYSDDAHEQFYRKYPAFGGG